MSNGDLQLEELARTNSDLDRKVFDLQALLKAGEALYDVLKIEPLCDLLMAMCRERARVDKMAVLVHDEESDPPVLRVRASRGLADEASEVQAPATDGILRRLLLAGEPFSIVDPAGSPRFPFIFAEHGLEALEGQLWIPLVMPDRLVGFVSLATDVDGRPISAEDQAFLSALCSQAAIAINTANLYEGIEVARRRQARSFHQLEILFDVSKKLGEVSELQEMLSVILGKAVGAVEAEKGSLMLVDESTDQLAIRVVEGLPPEVQRRINEGEITPRRFSRGEGVAGTVWDTRTIQRVNNVDADGNFTARDNTHVRSLLCVPLIADDEVIGVINITNRKGNQPFVEADESILRALADQAAGAITKARLYQDAITDGLTGLCIRRFAMHRLRDEVRRAARYGKSLAVIMCDIDHFKMVNDTYGHPVGDAVIVGCAQSILKSCRQGIDVAGRYGGEEFLLVLPETDLHGGRIAAERLRVLFAGLETPLDDGSTLQKTMSFGVTVMGPGDTAESLVKRADEALYASKEGGRNCVHAFAADGGLSEPPSDQIVDEGLAVDTTAEFQADPEPPTHDDSSEEAA